jgi:hypothetical protein
VPKVSRLAEVFCHLNKECARFSAGVFSRMQRAVSASPEVVKSFCTLLVWTLKFITVPTYAVSRASDVQFKPSALILKLCLDAVCLSFGYVVISQSFFWGGGRRGLSSSRDVSRYVRSRFHPERVFFFTECDIMLPVPISCILSFS